MSTKSSVSFSPAPHAANSLKIKVPVGGAKLSALSILQGAAPVQSKKCSALLQSSFGHPSTISPNVIPQKNGFVDTVVRCYNEHGALVIRPDDGKSHK
jgi:hypothetical protein